MTSTNMTRAPDSQSHLEWFTHDILPNGRQICSIRQIRPPSPNRLVLDEEVSTLLQVVLTENCLRSVDPLRRRQTSRSPSLHARRTRP
jgi:hypothetical protein